MCMITSIHIRSMYRLPVSRLFYNDQIRISPWQVPVHLGVQLSNIISIYLWFRCICSIDIHINNYLCTVLSTHNLSHVTIIIQYCLHQWHGFHELTQLYVGTYRTHHTVYNFGKAIQITIVYWQRITNKMHKQILYEE